MSNNKNKLYIIHEKVIFKKYTRDKKSHHYAIPELRKLQIMRNRKGLCKTSTSKNTW